MHFQELTLYTSALGAQKEFYCTTLGLSLLDETSNSFAVQAGTTRLSFQETQLPVLYHIAFTIPRNKFLQAKEWLARRVPLLRKDDEDELFFANINACSCYFYDADGNILEFIAHYNLELEMEGDFGPADVLHVSEIGLPVDNVPAQAEIVQEVLALKPYGGVVEEDFAFLGDIFGRLVMVKIGRPWLPTQTVLATPAPVHLRIGGQREQRLQLSPFPYVLESSLVEGA